MSKKSWVCKSCGWRVTSNDELEHGIGFVCGLGVATREKLPTVNGFYGMTIVRSPEEAVVNNTPDPIRDILNEFRQSSIIIHAKGSVLGVDEDVRAFASSIADAETALNAYILGEVMELIGEDDVQKPDDDEYDYPYCTTCDMCFFDGDKSNGCECTSRNRVRQELRNKANKKFGGK